MHDAPPQSTPQDAAPRVAASLPPEASEAAASRSVRDAQQEAEWAGQLIMAALVGLLLLVAVIDVVAHLTVAW